MGISFGSINSGLPKDIVQQIMQGERVPLKKMEERKEKVNSKMALLKDLTSRMEKLRGTIYANKSSRSFRELEVKTSGDGITATVDKNLAEPGNYSIEVLQLAQKSSAISNGIEDKDKTYLGVGYLQYELPNGDVKDVYIDSENSNLTGIAKLINKDSNNGMTATVVNSGDGSDAPWKLMITLSETGDDNKAIFPNLYLVDGEEDLYFEGQRDAQDAKIKLDGFEIEIPTNETADLIPGVSLNLKKAKPGEEINIEIQEDNKKITTKLDEVVNSINEVMTFIKEQNKLDESTDTSRTLGGDITLQTIESRIRGAIFTPIQTDYGPRRIGDLGIQFERTGLLSFDQEKFNSKISGNFDEVAQIVTGKYTLEDGERKGFMDNLEDIVNATMRRPSGTLTARKNGLDSQIKQIDSRIDRKVRQLEKKEQILKNKFARLEETISRIQTQGSGLSALGGGGFNPVQQLG